MVGQNLLGEFLRARREQLSPEDVGLSNNGHRRVRGLRREEVAELAEVSPDYYVRIEQGRQMPSEQVTRTLARALHLDDIATTYLFDLARRPPDSSKCGRSREAAGLALQTLLDQWTATPAWVSDRCTNCIAANALATELNPSFKCGRNTLRDLVLQEQEKREIFINYEECVSAAVASLRARAGGHLNEPKVSTYVRELESASPLFAQLWAKHEVRFHAAGYKILRHPVVGRLDFLSETMTVNDTDGYVMTLYYAEPGSETAEKVSELRELLAL